MIDFVPFLLFVIFMVGTPGPANMLLMTSGANFGFWRSLPFVAGVTLGKLLVNILLAFGLWELLSYEPRVLLALKIVCVAYLAWLALRMSGFLMAERDLRQPESFWKGLAVHPLVRKFDLGELARRVCLPGPIHWRVGAYHLVAEERSAAERLEATQ